MRSMISLALLSCFAFVLVACQKPDMVEAPDSNEQEARTEPALEVARETSPSPFPSSGQGDRYEGIETTEELFARLTPIDRRLMESFYGGYDSAALDIDNHEQLEWMIDHDYPMPDDIAAAHALTNDQLLALHESGSNKAGFFYLERKSNKDNPLSPQEHAKLDVIATEVLFNGSPFSGYAYAKYQEQVNGDPHRALTGYAWAGWMGDRRAMKAMTNAEHRLRASYPEVPLQASTAVTDFAALMKAARSRDPTLLNKKIQSIPFDSHQ